MEVADPAQGSLDWITQEKDGPAVRHQLGKPFWGVLMAVIVWSGFPSQHLGIGFESGELSAIPILPKFEISIKKAQLFAGMTPEIGAMVQPADEGGCTPFGNANDHEVRGCGRCFFIL